MAILTMKLDMDLINQAVGDWLKNNHPSLKDHVRTNLAISSYPAALTFELVSPDAILMDEPVAQE